MLSSKRFRLIIVLLILLGPWFHRLHAADAYNARGWYAMGRTALEEEDYFSAVDYFRAAIRLNPAYSEARMGMAEVLYLLGEYEEAYGELEDARTYAFADRRFVLLEARILTALGRYEEATALYRGVLESRPHDPEANRGLAEIYAISGQNELADAAYGKSLLYSPGNLRVLLQLVILHDESRNRERAENALLEALSRYPDSLQARIQAAEHYALYNEWDRAAHHLERALSMLRGPEDGRYRRVAMLDASLALRSGHPAKALEALNGVREMDKPDALYLTAWAYRELGMEQEAQSALRRILALNPENEIVRIYREYPLVKRKSGFNRHRDELSRWHLDAGRKSRDRFYFDRALGSYRRARLIDSTDAETWLAYADIIRLKGFPEKYRDELSAALREFDRASDEAAVIAEKLALLEHSAPDALGEAWGIEDAWNVESAAWTMAVFFNSDDQNFSLHDGAAPALSSSFAYLADLNSDIRVVDLGGGFGPGVRRVDSFTEAFRMSRNVVDYFVLLKLGETERSFDATATLYIARTGEEVTTLRQLRTGQGKVNDALELLAENLGSVIPERMRILGTDGDTILLDKGRWHGVEKDDEYVVFRSGTVSPAISEQGVSFNESDFLGTLTLTQTSESLSAGEYRRHGDFDFISPGDDVIRLEPPKVSELSSMPDPAFRSRLLAVP